MKLLGCLVDIFLVFSGIPTLFSIGAVPVCSLADSAQGFPVLHILATGMDKVEGQRQCTRVPVLHILATGMDKVEGEHSHQYHILVSLHSDR